MFSRCIDHAKSHYLDKDLVKKVSIAKDIVHLNYDPVIQISLPSSRDDDEKNSNNNKKVSSITYRDLTEREHSASFRCSSAPP